MLSLQKSLVPLHLIALAKGFQFQLSSPTQCDPLTVTWSGGQPPFNLLIFKPFNGPVQNISIPSAAYQNSQGSFSTTLQAPQTRNDSDPVMFSMSDATGVTAGGVSAVMTVGPSQSGTRCNLALPAQNFNFSLGSRFPVQCKPFSFFQFDGAIQPITVFVVVALGQGFILQAPVGNTFTWDAVNITANSTVMFLVTDAVGRSGGSSALVVVGPSDDASCISAPTSTLSSVSSSTSSSIPSGQSSGTDASLTATSHSSSHVATIAGATTGGLVALALVIFLFLWCRRRKLRDSASGEKPWTIEPTSPWTLNGIDPLLHGTASSTTLNNDPLSVTLASHTQRLTVSVPGLKEPRRIIKQSVRDVQSTVPVHGSTRPSRVIIHTDIEEIMEAVDLPPKYCGDRAPIPGFAASPTPSSGRAQA